MVALKLEQFGGMMPAVDPRLLPNNAAGLTRNTWLYSGALQGYQTQTQLYTATSSTTNMVYRIPASYYDKQHIQDSYWLEFDNPDTDVIRSPVINDSYERFYWAGNQNFNQIVPKYNTKARIAAGQSAYTLGVPAPSTAPTVSPAPTPTTGTLETRSYVYTWVTTYGEEGPPSPPTTATGYNNNTWTITVTAPAAGDLANRSLDKVRIYRTVTAAGGAATYFFVDEFVYATTTYADSISDDVVAANAQLQSTYWTAPPTDLSGMTLMPNGIIAGFRENEVWFCEPYRPHAWPTAYTINVEFPIVGLGVVGQSLIVCTTGYPYSVTGLNPSSMSMARIASFEPCVSRGSIVSTSDGVLYASPNGIVLAAPGTAIVVSSAAVTKDKWNQLLNLPTIRAVKLGTAYYCWGSVSAIAGCFEETAFEMTAFQKIDFTGAGDGALFDLKDVRVAYVELTSTDPIFNVWADPWTGEVLIFRSGKVYWVDVTHLGTMPFDPYVWRSKTFTMPNKRNLEAVRVWFEIPPGTASPPSTRNTNLVQTLGSTQYGLVRVYADGNLVCTRELRTSGEFMRLPSGFRATYWQVEIEARVAVTSIEVATTAKELIDV